MAGLVTPITSRVRDLCLDTPSRASRSVDSGYGSLDTLPTTPSTKRQSDRASNSLAARLEILSVNSYDGNSSEQSQSDIVINGDDGAEVDASPCAGRDRSATFPRVARRRISRTDSFQCFPFGHGNHQRYGSDNMGLQGSSNSSVKMLDRFVPIRDHDISGYEKLQTTKALSELTPLERLVRHNRDAPDPFCFRRRALPPSPTEARKASRSSNSTILDTATHSRVDRVVSQADPY